MSSPIHLEEACFSTHRLICGRWETFFELICIRNRFARDRRPCLHQLGTGLSREGNFSFRQETFAVKHPSRSCGVDRPPPLSSSATAGEKKKRDIEVVVTSGTSTQPPSPLGATTSFRFSPLPDELGKKVVEPSEGVQPGLPESDLEQPMHAGAHMVLVLTTTLVHLAVLGSGALFASWRAEDQVSSEQRTVYNQ